METELKELEIGQPYFIQNFEQSIKSWDPKTRVMVHKVSKETSDRYRDVVRISGISTANYKKNPVVLYGHDYIGRDPLPIIGKNQGFEIEGKRNPTLWAKSQYLDERKVSPKLVDLISDWIFLSTSGLGGWSLGFQVKKYEKILDENENWIGYDFTETDLIEYSAVVIPANQEAVNNALLGAKDAGDMDDERAERILRLVEKRPGDFVPALRSDEFWTPGEISADSEDEYEDEAEIDDLLDEEADAPGDEIESDPKGTTGVPVIKQSDLRIELSDEDKAALDEFEADFYKALDKCITKIVESRTKNVSLFKKFLNLNGE